MSAVRALRPAVPATAPVLDARPAYTLTIGELRELISEELGQLTPRGPATPRLHDRSELAEALGCSVPTVDRMRDEGMPEFRVGDSPRFELAAVLDWLRARGKGKP